jgi:hypothetical protein
MNHSEQFPDIESFRLRKKVVPYLIVFFELLIQKIPELDSTFVVDQRIVDILTKPVHLNSESEITRLLVADDQDSQLSTVIDTIPQIYWPAITTFLASLTKTNDLDKIAKKIERGKQIQSVSILLQKLSDLKVNVSITQTTNKQKPKTGKSGKAKHSTANYPVHVSRKKGRNIFPMDTARARKLRQRGD